MKQILTLVFETIMVLLSFTVTGQKDCSKPLTGWTPLMDFETGQSFMGFSGGLYGNNSNGKPDQYRADALQIALQVKPLNALGEIDLNGIIGFMAVGASNPRTEFNAFTSIAKTHPSIHSSLRWINSCIGGQGIQKMNQASDNYWIQTNKLLDSLGISPQQIQIIWIETENTANGNTKFPEAAEELADEYLVLLKTIRQLFPQVKICYLAARAYAGYATAVAGGTGKGLLAPRDYYNGWAIRFLMDKITSKLPGYYYEGANADIPFTTWGNYSWSDGDIVRKDGFFLDCQTDVGSDGLHLSLSGEQKIGQLMFNFFASEETAQPWLFEPITNTSNVNRDSLEISISGLVSPSGHLSYYSKQPYTKAILINSMGKVIGEYSLDSNPYVPLTGLPAGLYWIRFYHPNSGWSTAMPFVRG